MTVVTDKESQQAEQKKQIYITRVNKLINNIKDWFKNESLHIEQQQIEIKEKLTGAYTIPALSISTQTGQQLATIQPRCAYIILA